MSLQTIDQASFFGGPAPSPTPDQVRLCAYTPWRDVACLLRLCELHRPKRFLEIGCHRGATTLILSEAFPACYFIGCDPGSQVLPIDRNPIQAGEYLAQDRIGELAKWRPNVAIHRCCFAELPNVGRFDAIFVDGDHRGPALRADIDKALRLVNRGGFIAAHDVGNPLCRDVEMVLAESPLEFSWIENSWIAFYISP